MSPAPSVRLERRLLRSGAQAVGGVDEVGRGAIAGPVTVGIVVIHEGTPTAPKGTRDSKELSAAARARLAPLLRAWALDAAVGDATAREIDEVGIMAAMGRALVRAWADLRIRPEMIVLDGGYDFASPAFADSGLGVPTVVTRIGGDRRCASVAAASILAKTHRDAQMARLDAAHPGFGWARNVGYGSAEHREALRRRGPTPHHRRTFGTAGSS